MKFVLFLLFLLISQNESRACALDGAHEDRFDMIEELDHAIREHIIYNGASSGGIRKCRM